MPINFDLIRNPMPQPRVIGNMPNQQAEQQQAQQQQDSMLLQALMQQARLDQQGQQFGQQQQLAQDQFDFEKSIRGPAAEQDLMKGQHELDILGEQKQDRTRLRSASENGESMYIEELAKMDPNKAVDYLRNKQSLRSSILDNKSKLLDLDEKGLNLAVKRSSIVGNLGFTLLGAPEEQRAALHQQFLGELKKFDPNAPDEYNEGYYVAGMALARDVQKQVEKNPYLMARFEATKEGQAKVEGQVKDLLDRELRKSTYASTPDIMKLQEQRNLLLQQRDQLKKSGQDTSNVDQQIKELSTATTGISTGLDKDKQIKNASAIRQDYLTGSKDFQNISQSYGRIIASGQDPSAAGDLALIFNYMKMLDPNSVVRETEFANAQNAGSIPDRIRATWNKALRGERLSESQRADFMDRANRLYKGQEQDYEQLRTEYSGIATRAGLNPKDVTPDFRVANRGQQVQSSNQQNQSFEEGKIYKDAQGNRAKYSNGQWVPV